MRPDRRAGFSLLELMVVIVCFAIVATLVISVVLGASRSASIQTGVDVADRNLARVVDDLRSRLRSARMESLAEAPDMPGLSYRLPAETDDIDDDGEVQWGPLRRLQFEMVEAIDEASHGTDLNGDGDRTDRFLRCQLIESIDDGDPRVISGSSFVLDATSPYGDIDGDGQPDPPFTPADGGLRIVLWSLIRADVTGLRSAHAEITLRNRQEEGVFGGPTNATN